MSKNSAELCVNSALSAVKKKTNRKGRKEDAMNAKKSLQLNEM
jgi:hypothetical protein